MMKALKTLLGFALREDATVDELAPTLPAAEAELASAREASEAAGQAYQSAMLTADDSILRRLKDACADAAIRIDRAEELVRVLRERLAGAQDRAAEVARIEKYEEAKRKAADAREALQLYPQVVADIVAILTAVSEAEGAVALANGDLPRGAERLNGVEATVRGVLGEPERIISEVEVEMWVEEGRYDLTAFDQNAVVANVDDDGRKDGRGYIKVLGVPNNECRQVELRKFKRQGVLPATASSPVAKLIEAIQLPALYSGKLIISPLKRSYDGTLTQQEIENHLADVQTALRISQASRKVEMDRDVVMKLVPEAGAQPVKRIFRITTPEDIKRAQAELDEIRAEKERSRAGLPRFISDRLSAE